MTPLAYAPWMSAAWLLPLLLAIAVVVGSAGHVRGEAVRASIWHTFRAFLAGVALLGLIVHILSRLG